MNYIRGAVSAISAPYQYYKDINPATLTGAIDVIVIQRPSDNGDTELACSPFHVRFGKWQVLRPSEKKVTVSVNGHPIPFDMKIGEAGEAFFIFETDDDVPDDLITSPLLRASSPGPREDTGRFGAKKNGSDTDEPEPLDLNALPSPPEEDIQVGNRSNGNGAIHTHRVSASTSNAMLSVERPQIRKRSSSVSEGAEVSALPSPPPSPTRTKAEKEQDERADAALHRSGREVHVPKVMYQDGIALDTEGYHSQSKKSEKNYDLHSGHDRESSDRTIRAYEDEVEDGSNLYAFPSESVHKPDFGGTHLTHSLSQPHAVSGPPDSDSESDNSNFSEEGQQPLPLRATSEPPPDPPSVSPPSADSPFKRFTSPGKLNVLTPVQEYSWEWGAFPQPSPMKSTFGKGGRLEAGLGVGLMGPDEDGEYDLPTRRGRTAATWGRAIGNERKAGKGKGIDQVFGLSTVDSDDEGEHTNTNLRSRSVPPDLDESPTRERKREKRSARYVDANEEEMIAEEESSSSASGVYGAGGKLSMNKADPTVFRVSIEGKKVDFELGLVEYDENKHEEPKDGREDFNTDEELPRGRQARNDNASPKSKKSTGTLRVFSPDGRWPGIDEFETARLFEKGKISFEDFIQNDQLVKDPRLVIRWTQEQYISQRDQSPLMDALALWRDSYIQRKGKSIVARPISPSSTLSEEEQEDDDRSLSDTEGKRSPLGFERSKSEPLAIKEHSAPGVKSLPPTSSSWVQWWRRSRKTNVPAPSDGQTARPDLKEMHSAPSVTAKKSIPSDGVMQSSAPALPSTPVQRPVDEPKPTTSPTSSPKKYAKTLRLTSDQLKSLNLKPGPNSITFSLSMSGVVACTARIFMWDSTDLVLISDIDGTITKSDGLGHVFAMIGRDWTHLGVAKLYTDICRNGYKVLYLTSRAIGQADATRGYLKGIKQNDYQLPEGPVIMSPDRLMASLHREVIMRKPEVFKMACLRDIQRLFGEASRNPFYAGFGNRITDALSYRSVNVPSSRIFTIDSTGEVKCELLELAGYKSSYIHMTDLVDQMFPPIHRQWAPDYTDFNFWKPAIQEFALPDFSPPSPALSARSDNSSSTFARLRNFSLVSSRQSNIPRAATMAASSSSLSHHSDGEQQPLRNATLQQMSSFERMRDTLGFSGSSKDGRRSESPDSRSYTSSSYAGSEDEDEERGWNGGKRERRKSTTSMPGSLEDMGFDGEGEDEEMVDGGDEYDEEYDPDEEEMDEAAEEALDEDLLAAGEMKNVPFL